MWMDVDGCGWIYVVHTMDLKLTGRLNPREVGTSLKYLTVRRATLGNICTMENMVVVVDVVVDVKPMS